MGIPSQIFEVVIIKREYYVYAYFFKSSGHIFHIGKGKGNRYIDTVHSRNAYFKSIISKYKNDVSVKKLKECLTNEEACVIEKELIKQYKSIGQCETNFHEGGCGGNTGNYEQVSAKLKNYFLMHPDARLGENNPHFGHHLTEEQREHLSKKQKEYWTDEKRKEQSKKLLGKKSWNKGLTGFPHSWNYGKKMSEETYSKMMNNVSHSKYTVIFNGEVVYWTISIKKLYAYCGETFGISRGIVDKILFSDWKPKFKKHKHLESLMITKTNRGVSTNRDECSDVEWRLQPFEVGGNQ